MGPSCTGWKYARNPEADHQEQRKRHVHNYLARIKTLRWQFRIDRIFIDRTGSAGFSEQRNVETDEQENHSGNEEHMGHIEA